MGHLDARFEVLKNHLMQTQATYDEIACIVCEVAMLANEAGDNCSTALFNELLIFLISQFDMCESHLVKYSVAAAFSQLQPQIERVTLLNKCLRLNLNFSFILEVVTAHIDLVDAVARCHAVCIGKCVCGHMLGLMGHLQGGTRSENGTMNQQEADAYEEVLLGVTFIVRLRQLVVGGDSSDQLVALDAICYLCHVCESPPLMDSFLELGVVMWRLEKDCDPFTRYLAREVILACQKCPLRDQRVKASRLLRALEAATPPPVQAKAKAPPKIAVDPRRHA
eukprot:Platyproteum_vivax@DN3271_c0_g1_i1.p1